MILSKYFNSALFTSTVLALSLCSCTSNAGSDNDSSQKADYVYKVADEFEIPTVDKVGIYTFEQAHTPEGRFDDFLRQFVDDAAIKKGEKYYITGVPEGIAWEYENKIGDVAYNGYFVYDELPPSELSESDEQNMTDAYYFANEFAKTTITLDGKETTLAALLDDAKPRLVQAAKTLGCNVELKPVYSVVHSVGSEEYMAEIVFSLDNGDGSGINIFHDLEKNEADSPYFAFSAEYRSADKLPLLCNARGIILTKSFDEKKEYISCEEAMQKASDKLASNIDLTLHFAQLEYRPKVTSFDKSVWADKDTFDYQYGAEYTSEPYWALYFDVTENHQRVVYVNALSGEVELLFNN